MMTFLSIIPRGLIYVALSKLNQIELNLLHRCPLGEQVYMPNLEQITQANPKV